MQILAHRGWWLSPPEKNSLAALQAALNSAFGIETDIRDAGRSLVVSHDPPVGDILTLQTLLEQANPKANTPCLALNVKADGLSSMLKAALAPFPGANYFCFDMSVPETLVYRRAGLRFFTRESEFERAPTLYADAAGVWLDMFDSDWIESGDISRHLGAGKTVALVSPELHRRPHRLFWNRLKDSGLVPSDELMLCTDLPQAAREFFSS